MEAAKKEIRITKQKLNAILRDPEKSAKVVNLEYVHDTQPGIKRVKRGNNFVYLLEDKKVQDEDQLFRIRKLVIPPAWQDVWICSLENGHLQATGLDVKNRKQYRYHSMWSVLRNQTKFYRLHEFGKALPAIRARIEKDLALSGLPLNKVLAAVVSLMERTSIRVGNNMYEKLYGSYGLTTLKDKHVTFKGETMQFSFKGKKGVYQQISTRSKRLSNIVKQCRDIPGKELFQYYDEQGQHRSIDSGMVNRYLKEITGQDFTAKDFRTWAGTSHAFTAFKEIGFADTQTATKKNILSALDAVAEHLGNTRTVCKKYYVHPIVISLYENRKLENYFNLIPSVDKTASNKGLAAEEQIVMKILEKEGLFIVS